MKKYYYETTGREPDVDCVEDCPIGEEGKIGSVKCQECFNNEGSNHVVGWIKCKFLQEAPVIPMTLRQSFEDEVRDDNPSSTEIELLFMTRNEEYIKWLENLLDNDRGV